MSNIDNTLAERGSRYGEFTGHADITQDLKQAMKRSPKWATLANDQKEALEMVAHKVGRILNGDPNYIDSWTDIVGYTRLVEKRLIDEQAVQKEFAFGEQPKAMNPEAPAAMEKGHNMAKGVSKDNPEDCACLVCQITAVIDQERKSQNMSKDPGVSKGTLRVFTLDDLLRGKF